MPNLSSILQSLFGSNSAAKLNELAPIRQQVLEEIYGPKPESYPFSQPGDIAIPNESGLIDERLFGAPAQSVEDPNKDSNKQLMEEMIKRAVLAKGR